LVFIALKNGNYHILSVFGFYQKKNI